MPVNDIVKEAGNAMAKAVEHAGQHISKVRTGRASVTLLDNVKVDYYGTATPLAQVGNLSVPDARTILIQPWDKGTDRYVKDIDAIMVKKEKEILED